MKLTKWDLLYCEDTEVCYWCVNFSGAKNIVGGGWCNLMQENDCNVDSTSTCKEFKSRLGQGI